MYFSSLPKLSAWKISGPAQMAIVSGTSIVSPVMLFPRIVQILVIIGCGLTPADIEICGMVDAIK